MKLPRIGAGKTLRFGGEEETVEDGIGINSILTENNLELTTEDSQELEVE